MQSGLPPRFIQSTIYKNNEESDHNIMGVIPLVIPELLTKPVVYNTRKNLLLTESIDNHIASVDSQITSISGKSL